MQLLLVRHAMCDPVGHSLAGRQPGVVLNDEGRAQARAVAARLAARGLAAVYSSPLDRAAETARCIAEMSRVPMHIHAGLTEFDFGEWTGRTIESLRDDETWRRFNAHRAGTRAPGGESPLEAQARATTAVYELAERHGDDAVVAVSHADVIRGILCHLLGLSLDLQHRLEIDPASITTVELNAWGPRVLCLNEVVR